MVPTKAVIDAAAAGSPHDTRAGETAGAIVEAPYAAEKKPATVTPICTAERNRFGLRANAAVRAPRPPRCSNRRICPSRNDTRAISVAANTPPIRTKTSTNAPLTTISFIAAAYIEAARVCRWCPCPFLLGGVDERSSGDDLSLAKLHKTDISVGVVTASAFAVSQGQWGAHVLVGVTLRRRRRGVQVRGGDSVSLSLAW